MDKKHKLVGSDRFQPADFLIGRYVAKVPVGTTLEEVLHPKYFENHLNIIRRGMEITVLSDDFSLDARIRVLSVTKTTTTCRILEDYSSKAATVTKMSAEEQGEIKVTWGGPKHMHRVMHGTDIVAHGFATKEEAEAELEKYVASIQQ